MARPLYEQDSDRANERAAVDEICAALSCEAHKLPISYGLDYALTRDDRVISMLEIKCRDNSSQRYETIMVSVLKRMKALELRRAAGVTTNLVAVFSDGIFMIDFNEKPDFVSIGGRKDRGDSADIEPVVHYRIERLARVGFVDLTGGGTGKQPLPSTSLN